MTPDLEDALVPVKWAEAQMPIFDERFAGWERSRPYELVMEPNRNAPEIQFLVAYRKKNLDPLLIGDAGAIINSIRAALDIFWMLILRRHGSESARDSSFPVKRNLAEFEAAAEVLKQKYGCRDGEVAAVKRAKAYKGGDDFLHPLHQLAVQPRHHRLLLVKPAVDAAKIEKIGGGFPYPTPLNGQEKSILAGIPARVRFRPTYANVGLASELYLDEPALLRPDRQASLVLRSFASSVRGIIESFP